MKKNILTILSILSASYGFAQNSINSSGNVGIGIISPIYSLDVKIRIIPVHLFFVSGFHQPDMALLLDETQITDD